MGSPCGVPLGCSEPCCSPRSQWVPRPFSGSVFSGEPLDPLRPQGRWCRPEPKLWSPRAGTVTSPCPRDPHSWPPGCGGDSTVDQVVYGSGSGICPRIWREAGGTKLSGGCRAEGQRGPGHLHPGLDDEGRFTAVGPSLPLIHAGVTQLLIEEPRGGINNEERKHWVIIRGLQQIHHRSWGAETGPLSDVCVRPSVSPRLPTPPPGP